MKILITGGAGFIGSNLVRQIIEETGDSVINVDKLTYAGNLCSLADVIDNPRHVFEKVDICDAKALTELFQQHKPDAVMHLAAESHVDRSIDAPSDFIQTNVIGTFNLLQVALEYWKSLAAEGKSKFRFLHISTDEVYGSLTPEQPGFSESSSYDPHSPYSASKASSDHLVRAWSDTYGLPVLITNCSNNYGTYQFPEKLIPLVIQKCLNYESIPIYGNGENVRDWLHVSDHCNALRLVLEKGQPGTTYNIGGDNEMRNIDLVRKLCSLLNEYVSIDQSVTQISRYEELITFVSDRPGHDQRYAIDASKIKNELGWHPVETCESGLRKTVEWYLTNKPWCTQVQDGSYRQQRLGTV